MKRDKYSDPYNEVINKKSLGEVLTPDNANGRNQLNPAMTPCFI